MSALGHPRLHLRITDSTNERARALAELGAPHGTLVTASEQTAGRGRQGRHWSAPAESSLLMSLLLRTSPAEQVSAPLSLIAAVAVCDALGPSARVKWPNDVVLERDGSLAKLAGILVEGRPQQGWSVLGIGVNVALDLNELPPAVREGAASLGQSSSAIEPLLEQLLDALTQRLGEALDSTLTAWRALDALDGREVSWAGGSGRAEGIDESGRLLVRSFDGGLSKLDAGEVHLAGVSSSS